MGSMEVISSGEQSSFLNDEQTWVWAARGAGPMMLFEKLRWRYIQNYKFNFHTIFIEA